MITVKDIAWAAGFMEGEGSFMTRCRGAILLEATQVQKEPLEHLQKIFGGNLYYVERKPSMSVKARPYWRWTRMGKAAAGICMTLYTLMSPRRKGQIERCLAKYRSSEGTGGFERGKTVCPKGHAYTQENTYVTPSNGKRKCITCAREYNRTYVRRSLRLATC